MKNKKYKKNQRYRNEYETGRRENRQGVNEQQPFSGSGRRRSERVAVFIDGSNLFYAQKNMRWSIDPVRLLKYIEKTCGAIEDAYYYSGYDPNDNGLTGVNWEYNRFSPENGFTRISKPIKEIKDNGIVRKKCNLDVEMVLDMMGTIDLYDHAVLISGDSDFERALTRIKSRGKRITVIASIDNVSKELKNLAGRHYVQLENIKKDIISEV